MLRKYLNMQQPSAGNEHPFMCWQCVTLNFKVNDMDIVLTKPNQIKLFIEFLVYELHTLDGQRGSADLLYDQKFIQATYGKKN